MKRNFIILITVFCLVAEMIYLLNQPAEIETVLPPTNTDIPADLMPGPILPDSAGQSGPVNNKLVRKKLTYEAFDIATNNTIDRTFVYITEQPGGKKYVQWFLVKKDSTLAEEYVLSENWETLQWISSLANEGTAYIGEKQGRQLVLKGKFKNEDFTKTITLKDDLPFYFNPKLGLKGFVYSAQTKTEFWGFRSDELTEFRMKAEKKGVHRITLNGETFDALKIYWAATGLGEKFFNRTYYFRVSDGEFISQDPADKWKMKLMALEKTSVTAQDQKVDQSSGIGQVPE